MASIRWRWSFFLLPVALGALAALGLADRAPEPPAAAPRAVLADESTCRSCHAAQTEAWQGSHHQRAMQPATEATVLGDFADRTLATDVETTTFFRRDGAFWIRTPGADGAPADHRIAYTFGVEPLQQYLIEMPDGGLQAHGAAWDVERSRWFHLYDGQGVDYRHRLHWTGPQQNADFMCVECHTTGFERRYDPQTGRFDSRWHAPGVACQGCHGPASNHLRWAADPARVGEADRGFDPPLRKAGEPAICARCHSRRTPIAPAPVHGGELFDDYLPMILAADLYQVDGKIEDEVFEYGSFVQSRMYAAGVACSDCHDPHRATLRAPGDATCTRCHNPAARPTRPGIDGSGLQPTRYDDPSHHHHAAGSPGSACVDCHMPGRVYMGNDLRHDHAFTSPHPVQARALGHADACLGCHDAGEADAVVAAFERWYPAAAPRDGGYARDLHAARAGAPGAAQALLRQLARADLPDIRRATLVAELPNHPSPAAQRALAEALASPAPIVRRTAAEVAGALLPPAAQARLLAPLTRDPVRAVRLAAAWQLLQLPPAPGADPQARIDLAAEYEQVQRAMLDRAEAHHNLAGIYLATGRAALVEPALRRALERDPAYAPARLLLAQWREQAGDAEGALRLLLEGIERDPGEASLWHGLGLLRVRRGERAQALEALRRAHELAPDEPEFGFVLAVALHDGGAGEAALDLLRAQARHHPTHRMIRLTLVRYLREAGHPAEAVSWLERWAAQNPDDPLLARERAAFAGRE